MALAKNITQISAFMAVYEAVAVDRADKVLSLALVAAARWHGWRIRTVANGRFVAAFAPLPQAVVCAA